MVCVVLAINALMTVCQIINSYSEEIYEWFKPCLMKLRQSKKADIAQSQSHLNRDLLV